MARAAQVRGGQSMAKKAKKIKKPRKATGKRKVARVALAFTEFFKFSDYDIQQTLRGTDQQDLSTALWGADRSLQECFFRNMSKRAAALIAEDVRRMERPTDAQIERARGRMLKVAAKVRSRRRKGFRGMRPMVSRLKAVMRKRPMSDRDATEACELLKEFAEVARRYGILSLESTGLVGAVDEWYARMGLKLVVDGSDPGLVEEILDAKKKALITEYERKLDVIRMALVGIQKGQHPGFIEIRCKARLP
jgi:hypothetical protein